MWTKTLKSVQEYQRKKVSINGKTLTADIADTHTKRGLGLMHRKSLGKNQCMLFLFDGEASQPIWMRHMNFQIDAIWLDNRKKIVHAEENLKPAKYFEFKTYSSRKPAKYIIELPAGFIKKNRLRLNSRVSF